MAITVMQEIFILLEDEKEVPFFRLNRWGRQSRGALAKLAKLGWAQKTKKDGEIYYQITAKGEKEFDKILKPLRQSGSWDGRWRLVMFDIPENQRAVRDRLRRALTRLGLGILQASVWISPNDIRKDIEEIAKRLNLEGAIRFFEVSRNENLNKTIIEKSWNLPELSDLYKKFNFSAERLSKFSTKKNNHRLATKKLIFEYALILQKDPILPWEFRQKDDLRQKAHENYLALRKLIY